MNHMNIAPHLFEEMEIVEKGVGKVAQVGYDLRATKVIDIETGYKDNVLKRGRAYEIELCEVKMPDDCWGYIFGRSTFNRQGILIRSSVIDPGYHGKIGVTAYVLGKNNVYIEVGDRVGQLLVFKANVSGKYDGQYQNERLGKTGTKK